MPRMKEERGGDGGASMQGKETAQPGAQGSPKSVKEG